MNNETAQLTHPNGNGDAGRHGAVAESGNVDRIRDILFGTQMREYDGRFQRLEDRLAHEAAVLRDDLQKRLDALEGFVKGAVESLNNRVRAEQAERSIAIENLGRTLAETAKAVEAKIGRIDERAAAEVGGLRQQLLEQSKILGAEMHAKHEELRKGLDNEAQMIRGAMTGRESLAEMLTEVALRLKGEFRVPGAS